MFKMMLAADNFSSLSYLGTMFVFELSNRSVQDLQG
jgi:hypothetical protein